MSDVEVNESAVGSGDAEPSAGSQTCFIIGPIGNRHAAQGSDERTTFEEAIQVVEEVIEPACEAVGLVPVRADGLSRAGEITEQVFRRLRDDDVVIADLTGANANVMYELGLTWSKASRGDARWMGCPLGLEQRSVRSSDGGSD